MGAVRGEVRLRAHAKVNYALEVVGTRGDGYHEVRMVMQSVSLADEVRIERTRGGFDLLVEPKGVSIGPREENTAYRAWRLLSDHVGGDLPVRIALRKNIPAGAGLGGGSTDAAAVLRGLDRLFGLGLATEELRGLGKKIGADVPFCLSGGTALGEGVGEILTPLPPPPEHRLLIAKPFRGADTGKVYRAYDANPTKTSGSVGPVVAALGTGELGALAAALGNDLAPVTKDGLPEVSALEKELLEAGALGASMTGSGTAVYGVFGDDEAAAAAKTKIRVPFTGVYAPVDRGSRET